MKVFAKDNTTGPSIKAAMPCTPKPGTSAAANQKQKPLTISEKPPNVAKFKGSDKVDTIGLIELLIKPITKAAIMAAGKLAITTPRKSISTTSKLNAVARTVKNAGNITLTYNLVQDFLLSITMFLDKLIFYLFSKED